MHQIHEWAAIVLVAMLVGCRAVDNREGVSPSAAPMNPAPNRHLIFSPDTEVTLVLHDYGREWPSAIEAYQPLETIDYKETISDRQDRRGGFEDQHFRRFDSVRTGRLVR